MIFNRMDVWFCYLLDNRRWRQINIRVIRRAELSEGCELPDTEGEPQQIIVVQGQNLQTGKPPERERDLRYLITPQPQNREIWQGKER
jgi:hypothetical protein